ncbi:MAG: CopZ family metallochaperone [Leptospirillia bacterium]
MATTVLKVGGMTCNHCVMAVTKALEAVPGVTKAHVSLEKGQAVVEGSAPREALVGAIKAEDYEVE